LEGEVRAAADGSRTIGFPGFVKGDEKRALIDGCRAMLGPSVWWEPLGLVTYESYDAAKPMLAAAS
ncbi:MAG: glycosyltransferase family 4 protein, partial [Akkermansiaceae bacterium]|nr:glycosyltransferase family 4 protein [Akkermansiaceae bacterium]